MVPDLVLSLVRDSNV
jgi:hypothetical protein